MTKQWVPLTDSQWAAISPFFNLKRKRKHDLRQIMDAILWLLRTGCQWRNLPTQWPNWQAVYYYFQIWKTNGTLQALNHMLCQLDRQQEGLASYPSLLSIDSQSVKLSPLIGESRGLDAYKRINGRKRQILVDTGGRLWFAWVHRADEADGRVAAGLMADIACLSERLKKIVGDQAYNGIFAQKLADWGIRFEKASRPETARGFVPIAKRWVVERSIAWTNFYRRLVKDYEYTVSSSAAWLYLANIQILLQRIRHNRKT
jgi:transposase